MEGVSERFVIARNPDASSRLPYLLSLPLPTGPLVLATGDTWPATRDLYCHARDAWPDGAEVLDEVPVTTCRRTGAAIHLILARRSRRRSLFVFTEKRGRPLIFWRSERTVRAARPGLRLPQARGLERGLRIAIDTRERYAWRFAGKPVDPERRRLPVGDYGVFDGDRLVAAVERKRSDELASDAIAGGLDLAMAELAALPRGAVIVEGRLSDVAKAAAERDVTPGWLLNLLAALQATHPSVPILFAETPKLAGDLAYRWLAACLRQVRTPQGSLFSSAHLPREAADLPRGAGADARLEPRSAVPEATRGHARRDAPLPPGERRRVAVREAERGAVWTGPAYAERFGVSRATALADLRALRDAGALIAEGRTRSLRYRLAPTDGPDVDGSAT